ncbi:3-deoxy-D-manno-octulosonate 8-phosphate phosphatase KdsC [bacterium BMS3Abin04]|nr:3-deoxy-D-manno-octulosonate 8-phosphate phosphatase KdsC [bacterium BMS3Abin04]
MESINRFLLNKLSKIKLVITDVDGVLTDGGLYYSSEGLVMKKFNVKDGMGVRLLRNSGILTGIITTDGDSNQLINKRVERLKLDFLYTGVWDKESKLKEACIKYNLNLENVAFIGDDVNDLSIMKEVGFSTAPSDAVVEVLDVVDLVLQKKGGEGVFRELADLIIKAQM